MAIALVMVPAEQAHARTLLFLWNRGPDVAEWQRQLNQALPATLAVDGIFGPLTADATRRFQGRAGIEVDGVVGPQTRAAMREASGAPPGEPAPPAARRLRRGDTGGEVRTLQRRLSELGYWVGPVDGIFGTLTEQAVVAFQKVNSMTRDGIAGEMVSSALQAPTPFRPRSDSGHVMEVDKSLQVLVSVRDGRVEQIWNTSTGTEKPYTFEGRTYLADTPPGRWVINRQIDGWRESNLGRLYRPKYFHRDGIAIHGYPNVPAHPASHGCVRVSMDAMDYLWDRLPLGTPVFVYD